MSAFLAFLPWALIPVLLVVACLRAKPAPVPAILPFLIESIDHMDPTRSHESKPSERMREARYMRRAKTAALRYLVIAGALLFVLSRYL